jgi:nitroreductase
MKNIYSSQGGNSMNQTIETILKRKGTMSYSAQQIKDEDLNLILEAGIAAPTARNNQNWHFTVVQNKDILQQIDNGTLKLMGSAAPGYHPLYQAPTVIVVSAPADYFYADQDCAIAVENMSIAATSLGLGSRYLLSPTHFFEHETGSGIKKEIGIPDGYKTVACLSVGYDANPDREPTARNKNVVNYVK